MSASASASALAVGPSRGESLPACEPAVVLERPVEALYRIEVATAQAKIELYAPASRELQELDTPPSFAALLAMVDGGWTIPAHDLNHPVMRFLIRVDRSRGLSLEQSGILARNTKSFGFVYALLSGEVNAQRIVTQLQQHLGARAEALLAADDLKLTWNRDCKVVRLSSSVGQGEVPVSQALSRVSAGYEVRPSVRQNRTAIDFDVKLPGQPRIDLVDNAYGRIKSLYVFLNPSVRYRTLLAICRGVSAEIQVLHYPADELLHCVAELAGQLAAGQLDGAMLPRIAALAAGRPWLDSRVPMQQLLARTKAGLNSPAAAKKLVRAWQQMHRQLFEQLAPEYEQRLTQQLSDDGVDLGRVHIWTTLELESRWARDYFLMGRGPEGRAVLLESSYQTNHRNPALGRVLIEKLGGGEDWRQFDIRLPLDGGDMRAVGDRLFIGRSVLNAGLEAIRAQLAAQGSARVGSRRVEGDESAESLEAIVLREYEALFDRRVVVVGDASGHAQALRHIDMFATFVPVGESKPTVVLADLDAALAILEDLPPQQLAEVEREMLQASLDPADLCHASDFWVYRGQFAAHDLIESLVHSGLTRFLRAQRASEERAAVQRRLDAAASWFVAHGYTVVRAPSLACAFAATNTWTGQAGRAKLGLKADTCRRLYNNGLVECYVDGDGHLQQNVYLPSYGLRPIEDRLRRIYADLGYVVHFVDGMWEAGCGEGGLDCLSSELRGPFREQ